MAQGEDPNVMTFYALLAAQDLEEPYRSLLLTLADLESQGQVLELGAPYELLESIANICGFDEHEYARWCEIAARIPLSSRQALHILHRLKEKRGSNIFTLGLTSCTAPDERSCFWMFI
jgi:hypothetical protein